MHMKIETWTHLQCSIEINNKLLHNMDKYLCLVIPDRVETESAFGVIKQAKVLICFRD